MTGRRGWAFLSAGLALALTGCSAPGPDRDSPPAANTDNPLEAAAEARGLVVDASRVAPDGSYERQHDLGRDGLCIAGGRFGLSAAFGPGLRCAAGGNVQQDGDALILRFSGSPCRIRATFTGDAVIFPGAVDQACDDLCPTRVTFAGLSIPRTSWDANEGAAMALQDRDGEAQRFCR